MAAGCCRQWWWPRCLPGLDYRPEPPADMCATIAARACPHRRQLRPALKSVSDHTQARHVDAQRALAGRAAWAVQGSTLWGCWLIVCKRHFRGTWRKESQRRQSGPLRRRRRRVGRAGADCIPRRARELPAGDARGRARAGPASRVARVQPGAAGIARRLPAPRRPRRAHRRALARRAPPLRETHFVKRQDVDGGVCLGIPLSCAMLALCG